MLIFKRQVFRIVLLGKLMYSLQSIARLRIHEDNALVCLTGQLSKQLQH
jgi:hypothetical protein